MNPAFVLPLLVSLPLTLSAAVVSVPSLTDESVTDGSVSKWAALTPFMEVSSGRGAKEATSLHIAVVKESLRVKGVVSSFALNASSNQRDSFKAAATQRDKDVSLDDSVELRFEVSTPEGGRNFYVAVNALGTVEDMIVGANGWDASWDGVSDAKAAIKDGCWEFDLVIPLEALGVSPDMKDSPLRFNAVRFDRLNEEVSSWVYLEDGNIQSAAGKGKIVFRDQATLIRAESVPLPLSSSTSSKWMVVQKDGQLPIWWKSELVSGGQTVGTLSGEAHVGPEPVGVAQPRPRSESIEPRAKVVWLEGENVIYETPLLPYYDESRDLKAHLRAEAPVDVYVNDRRIASAVTEIDNLAISLSEGANVIAIDAPAGKAVYFRASDAQEWEVTSGAGWRVAEAGEEGRLVDLDSRKLPHAEVLPAKAGVVGMKGESSGKEEGRVTLRRTLLNRYTSFHRQSGGGQLVLPQDGTILLRWQGEAPSPRAYPHSLEAMRLMIDLPEGVGLIGASKIRRNVVDEKPVGMSARSLDVNYEWKEIGKTTRNGKPYRRYMISRDLPVFPAKSEESWLEEQARQLEGVVLGIHAETENTSPGSAFVWIEADGEGVIEYPRQIPLAVRQKDKGSAPSRIAFVLVARDGSVQDEKLAKAYFETIANAGINLVFGETVLPELPGLQQMHFFNLIESSHHNATTYTPLMDKLLQAYPEARAISFQGTPEQTPCLIYLAKNEEPWALMEQSLREVKERHPAMTQFFWDYEFSPFPGHHPIYPGFSAFGIKAFAEEYGLPGDLTPQVIHAKYSKEWIDFTAEALGVVMKKIHRAAKEINLGLYVYSGYQLPYTLENYNIDWKQVGPNIDAAICGYTSDSEIIAGTKETLGKTPLFGALLLMGKTFQSHTPAQIIAKLIDHPEGICFWYESGFDADTLASIAKASRFASEREAYLIEGKRITALPGGTKQTHVAFFQKENEVLVVVHNDLSSAPLLRRVGLPKGTVVESLPEGVHQHGDELIFQVPGGEFISLLLEL